MVLKNIVSLVGVLAVIGFAFILMARVAEPTAPAANAYPTNAIVIEAALN